MEYQKMVNLLHNTLHQPSKFRSPNWLEINNDAREMYNTNSQIKFETTILKLRECDWSD